jgi:GDPmannose 4,6-dehydratase
LDWKNYVRLDPGLVRPAEVNYLCGDASKARSVLGWEAQTDFRKLIEMMVDSDLAATSAEVPASRVAGA